MYQKVSFDVLYLVRFAPFYDHFNFENLEKNLRIFHLDFHIFHQLLCMYNRCIKPEKNEEITAFLIESLRELQKCEIHELFLMKVLR